MQPSLSYQIQQAIRRAGHHSNAHDIEWDNFLRQVPDLLAQAVESTDEIPTAVEIVFSRVSGREAEATDGDHHSPTYGEPITQYYRITRAALELAQDIDQLKRLIKTARTPKIQPNRQ